MTCRLSGQTRALNFVDDTKSHFSRVKCKCRTRKKKWRIRSKSAQWTRAVNILSVQSRADLLPRDLLPVFLEVWITFCATKMPHMYERLNLRKAINCIIYNCATSIVVHNERLLLVRDELPMTESWQICSFVQKASDSCRWLGQGCCLEIGCSLAVPPVYLKACSCRKEKLDVHHSREQNLE